MHAQRTPDLRACALLRCGASRRSSPALFMSGGGKVGPATAVCVALALLASAPAAPAQTRGVTAGDYYSFETLSDPRFSPDGATIAFVVTTVDEKQNRRRGAIWSVPADG